MFKMHDAVDANGLHRQLFNKAVDGGGVVKFETIEPTITIEMAEAAARHNSRRGVEVMTDEQIERRLEAAEWDELCAYHDTLTEIAERRTRQARDERKALR